MTVTDAALLTARPKACVTVHTTVSGDLLSLSAPEYVYEGLLEPTATPSLVHAYVSPVVAEVAVRTTVSVTLLPTFTLLLTGCVAMTTVDRIATCTVPALATTMPKFGTRTVVPGTEKAEGSEAVEVVMTPPSLTRTMRLFPWSATMVPMPDPV